MKKWLMLLMILAMFCSTAYSDEKESTEPAVTDEQVEEIIEIVQSVIVEEVFVEPLLGFELFYGDFNVDTVHDIPFLLRANLSRVAGNDWDDPETIIMKGFGNLNGFTTMFINIAKVTFDIEYDIAIIDTRDYLGDFYGKKYHPMPMLDGVIYNVFNMSIYFPEEPLYVYKFGDVFLNLSKLGPGV